MRIALPNIDPFGTTFDPATASFNGRFLALTGDGLLTYRQVEGEAGTARARSCRRHPQISPNRKTYHFQLLPNIHYSNGKLVTASDVRYTFERVLRLASPDTFGGIRGGKSCRPRRCDLSAGIVTDNTARTVTFHLYAPDPDFLYKLAFTSATIVPAGTPVHEASGGPFQEQGRIRSRLYSRICRSGSSGIRAFVSGRMPPSRRAS